jgi:hypothetical protein
MNLVVILYNAKNLIQHYSDGIRFIESVSGQQLTSVIGHNISPEDLKEYMVYHSGHEYPPRYPSFSLILFNEKSFIQKE